MNLVRNRLICGVAVLLVFAAVAPIQAISPSIVMLYGGQLEKPLMLRPAGPAAFPAFGLLWWHAGSYAAPHTLKDAPLLSGLAGRPYLNFAVFWGAYDEDPVKPEDASQHGRLYLPTASAPAVVVVTMPDMRKRAHPIPQTLDGFAAAWTLDAEQRATVRSLGVPGL